MHSCKHGKKKTGNGTLEKFAALYCAILCAPFFSTFLKFFGTSITSLDPETVQLPAFYILSTMVTGVWPTREAKPRFGAMLGCTNAWMIVKRAYCVQLLLLLVPTVPWGPAPPRGTCHAPICPTSCPINAVCSAVSCAQEKTSRSVEAPELTDNPLIPSILTSILSTCTKQHVWRVWELIVEPTLTQFLHTVPHIAGYKLKGEVHIWSAVGAYRVKLNTVLMVWTQEYQLFV